MGSIEREKKGATSENVMDVFAFGSILVVTLLKLNIEYLSQKKLSIF